MKSKTSFFNSKLYLQNLRRAWPVGLAYLIFLLIWLPYFLFMDSIANFGVYSDRAYVITSNMRVHIEAVSVMIVAVIAVIVVFSYLYQARSAYMMHSLPVTRLQLFTSGMAAALTLMWVPQVITALVTLGVLVYSGTGLAWLAGWWLISQMLTTLFFTGLAVFAAVFAGHGVAAVFFYAVLNFLFAGFSAIWAVLTEIFFYGVDISFSGGGVLTPVAYITSHTGVVSEIGRGGIWKGAHVTGALTVVIYALAGIGLMVIAYLVYRRRQIETAGDFISEKWLKPVFRIGAAACFGLGIAAAATMLEKESGVTTGFWAVFAAMLIQTVIIGFIVYFAAEMIIRKSFRVFSKRQWLVWGIFSVCAVIFIALLRFDAFGIQTWVPDPGSVESVSFTAYGDTLETSEETEDVAAIHSLIVENLGTIRDKEASESSGYHYYYEYDYDYTTIAFRYHMNDGREVSRRYSVYSDTGAGEEILTAADELLSRPDHFDDILMGGMGEDAVIYDISMNMFVPNEEEGWIDETWIAFNEGTGWEERLLSAIRQDFEEGHISFRATDDQYQNTLDIVWHSTGRYDIEDEYYGIDEDQCSIRLSPECVHTLAVLAESDQFFEEGLITRAEYFANGGY